MKYFSNFGFKQTISNDLFFFFEKSNSILHTLLPKNLCVRFSLIVLQKNNIFASTCKHHAYGPFLHDPPFNKTLKLYFLLETLCQKKTEQFHLETTPNEISSVCLKKIKIYLISWVHLKECK